MYLLMLLPLLLGVLGIVGSLLLLSSGYGSYRMAALLFLISGVLFSLVTIVDLARARKSDDASGSEELKPAHRMSR